MRQEKVKYKAEEQYNMVMKSKHLAASPTQKPKQNKRAMEKQN